MIGEWQMSPLPIAIDIRPTGGTYRPVGPSPESARSSTGSPLGTLAFLPLIFMLVTAACHHIAY